ncbi:SMC-Scp complex subunit ScpB [bacterium]|nr:SMC-Scp complex subunit ScpB [bacterium]|tara:strand:- start:206 stop:760 length:555 start_codon:yes stop_codon:yes gene_type:complete
MSLVRQKVEALLFISARPLTVKQLTELTKAESEHVRKAIEDISSDYNQPGRGVQLQKNGQQIQFVTSGDAAGAVRQYIKDETTGELTRPQLETLTVVAYRGPVTKAELEQIRGVNCSLILRNLLIRGLVEEERNRQKMETSYRVTFDFLRFLGLNESKDLPDFEKLNSHEALTKIIGEVESSNK